MEARGCGGQSGPGEGRGWPRPREEGVAGLEALEWVCVPAGEERRGRASSALGGPSAEWGGQGSHPDPAAHSEHLGKGATIHLPAGCRLAVVRI